jgi:hypothetical protein
VGGRQAGRGQWQGHMPHVSGRCAQSKQEAAVGLLEVGWAMGGYHVTVSLLEAVGQG